MAYKDLYNACQSLGPKVSRRELIPLAVLHSGAQRSVEMRLAQLDTEIIRGFFVSANNQDHPIVKQHHGNNVIIVARDLNYCWKRMVGVKELMHLFDQPDEVTGSPLVLDQVLQDLSSDALASEQTAPTVKEHSALLLALGVLCPEQHRLEFAAQRQAKITDDYAIALKLKIPQKYVPFLFEPGYLAFIKQQLA